MKKSLSSIFLILICYFGYGQTYPVNTNLNNVPTTLTVNNALKGKLIITSWADTSAANAENYLKNYVGGLIYTTGDSSAWYRIPNKWIKILPSGSVTAPEAWLTPGNIISPFLPVIRLGTANAYELPIQTNGVRRLTVPVDGLKRTSDPLYKYVMIDTSGAEHYLAYGDGGGSGGSTLTSIGSGYAVGVTGTNNVKSIKPYYGIVVDSTVSGEVGIRVDSTELLGQFWGTRGNTNTTAGTNFIGTTDSVDFVGKTNNTERFRWNARGALAVGSGTDYGISGQALISQGSGTPNTWKNIQDGWYNIVRDGNADTTGISDVSSIIQNAINAGWKNIFIPKGSFLVSTQIQMADSVNIKGAGRFSSSIKLASDITAFKCSYSQGGNRATFQDFGFYGNYATGGGTSQYGIFIDSAQAILVDGISGNNIGGYVVSIRYNGNCCADYITRASKSNTITNSYFVSNYGAVQFNTRAEYNIISNSTFTSNVYAIYCDGGNNRIEGNSVVKNTYGFYMVGGSNNGHGLATGNTVNHNGTNLYMNGVTLGYNFFNNSFSQNTAAAAGLIEMISSSFVNFTGGYMINDTVRMTSCTNVTFNGVRKYSASLNPVWVIVSGEAPTVFNVGDSVNTITLKDVVASKKIDISLPASLTGNWKQVYPDKSGTFAMTSDITGGTVTGTGTANNMTKFTGTSAIGNALMTDDGSVVTLASHATSGNGLAITNSAGTSGSLVALTNTGTAAASNTKNVLAIVSSGANGTSSQTVTGQTISVTNTGTNNINVGLNVTASGATNNYALLATGLVGFGTSTPNATFENLSSITADAITTWHTRFGGTYTMSASNTASSSPVYFSITPTITSGLASLRPIGVSIKPTYSGTMNSKAALYVSNTAVAEATQGVNSSIMIQNTGTNQNAVFIDMGGSASTNGLYIRNVANPVNIETVNSAGIGININSGVASVNYTPLKAYQSASGSIGSPLILEARNTTATNTSVYTGLSLRNSSTQSTGSALGNGAGVGIDFQINNASGTARTASINAIAPNQSSLSNVIDLAFNAVDNSGTANTIMTVSGENSRVGIGTTTPSEKLSVAGNLKLNTAGNKIFITTGSNASVGLSGAMTAGTITISTTAVTASSLIFLTAVGSGTGQISLGTVTAGTSFVINSSDILDTRTVQWWIIN